MTHPMGARVTRVVVAVLASVLALPAVAAAEEGPLTWVILNQLKPGAAGEWAAAVKANYGPVLDGLVADGTILSWGLLERESGELDLDHAGWATYPSWAAAAAADEAFAAHFGGMSGEDRAKVGAAFAAVTEPHKAQIRYLRGLVFEVDPEAAPGSYLVISDWQAGPGQDQAVSALYETVRPAFAQAMADGAISGYGLYVPELHDGGPSHTSWYVVHDLGGIAAVDAAIAAAVTEETAARMPEVMDMSAHRDTLWRIVHMATAGAGGGGEDGGGAEGGGEDGGEGDDAGGG